MARRGESEFLRQMKEELRSLQQQRKRIEMMQDEDRDFVQDMAEMTWDDDLAKIRNLVKGSLEQVEKKIQESVPVPTRKTSSPSKRPNLPDLVPGTIGKTERMLPEAPSQSRDRLLRTVMAKLQGSAQSRLDSAVREPEHPNYPSRLNTGLYEYQYGGIIKGPKNPSVESVDQKLKKLSRAALPAVSVAAPQEIRTSSYVFQETCSQPEGSTLRMDDIADVVGEILQEEMSHWIGDFQVPVLCNPNQELSLPQRSENPLDVLKIVGSAEDVGTQARPAASEVTTQTLVKVLSRDMAVGTLRHEVATHATQTPAEEQRAATPEEWFPVNVTEERGVNTRVVEFLSAGTQYTDTSTQEEDDMQSQLVDEMSFDDELQSEPRILRAQPEPPVDIACFFGGCTRLSSLSPDIEDVAVNELPKDEGSSQNTSKSQSSGLSSTRRDLSPGQIERFPESIIDTTFSISEGEVLLYQHLPRLPLDGASEGEVSEGQWSSAELNRTYTAGLSNPVAQTFSAGEVRYNDVSTAEDLTTEFDSTLAN